MNTIEKNEKFRRASHRVFHNRVMSAWSFGKIHTFRDYLIACGYDDNYISRYFENELNEQMTFGRVKDLLEDIRISVETELWLIRNPPEKVEQYENNIKQNGQVEATLGLSKSNQNVRELPKQVSSDDNISSRDNTPEDLPPSPNEKVFLFTFQKKATKQLLDNVIVHKLHAQLLVAQAGLGKTFILGAFLRRLLDMEFHRGKTLSPWAYCYLTKASVVEQTKRVLKESFCIDTIYQCLVTNYDQMRAKFGELFVNDKTVVKNGQEHIIWEWKPGIHPCVFIVDECQAAKNEDSSQSKIICSISEIKHPFIYTIFSSATPFTRVSEAKYLAVNLRNEI